MRRARIQKKEPLQEAAESRNSRSSRKRSPEAINTNGAKDVKRSKVDHSQPEIISALSDIMANFNLDVNELFHLKEYKSLVYWNPSDFSEAVSQPPELYQGFVKDNKYKLDWFVDEHDDEKKLDDLPLRLAKKVLAQREQKIIDAFPFRDDVLQASKSLERKLIEGGNRERNGHVNGNQGDYSSSIDKKKSNGIARNELNNVCDLDVDRSEADTKGEQSEEEQQGCLTSYKLKSLRYSIPAPVVTHPSHIPNYPDQLDSEKTGQGEKPPLPTKIKPLQVIINRRGQERVPEIEESLKNVLNFKFRTPIIDEGVTNDFNFTLEEYENVTRQQEAFLKRIYYKVNVEKSLELVGDKIERRRVVLPHASNARNGLDPFRSTGSVVPKVPGSSGNLTFDDYLLTQGMNLSRLRQHNRKQHQIKARKIAQMVDQYFKKKKGEKERILKEREQNLKKISRIAAQAVKKRWTQATKVVKYLRAQKEDELKRIRGREHLNQMLEHSSQLLEAQLSNSSSKQDSKLETSEISDFEEEEGESEVNDMDLSVEELRKKYEGLNDLSSQSESSIDSDDEDEIIDEVNSNSVDSVDSDREISENDEVNDDTNIMKSDGKESVTDSQDSDLKDNMPSQSQKDRYDCTGKRSDLSLLLGSRTDVDDRDTSNLYEPSDDGGSNSSNFTSEEDEDEPKTPNSALSPISHSKESEVVKEEEVNGSLVRDVAVPFLIRGTLRPYQKQGLNWLASLYNNNTNGILADEMGLGKTLQTISLLAYLACEHHIWGPHLIVVPTSVMLNWEMEFKKFAPGFKVLTYYGSPQQRAQKRKGWNRPDAFHVCITSYQLVVHDHSSFKRRKWRYMILDEAHNIKNFRSTRWRALLNFNTENRLLLTGTPLQNNLIELWSLLYFLMPSSKVSQAMPDAFANLDDFQQWFGRPVDKILEQVGTGDVVDENDNTTNGMDSETKNTVSRLHQVLRPYLLRRLKKDVEKQMPGKYEHIIYCRLSKRQRFLYDDFMSRAQTKETLASGNFLSIINCLMQLRKVCNHPDLFEVRPILTSFAMPKAVCNSFAGKISVIKKLLCEGEMNSRVNFNTLNLDITNLATLNTFVAQTTRALKSNELIKQRDALNNLLEFNPSFVAPDTDDYLEYYKYVKNQSQLEMRSKLNHFAYLNDLRCGRSPIYGESLIKKIKFIPDNPLFDSEVSKNLVLNIFRREEKMSDIIDKYSFITPRVVVTDMRDQVFPIATQYTIKNGVQQNQILNPLHRSQTKLAIAFPDKSLLQYDCGKLQRLSTLLQTLTAQGHRALIFTQMTKVLDVLEQFLNIHGYRYMRLDGATKIDDRQLLTERFNRDNKIPVFILSTRSGGLGINLTGADTVIFYDSDWNPAMDKQCQDRCHRIGQMRDVHIYRLVSEYTIESNILKKANQKRQLDNVVIQGGEFTTDYFGKLSLKDLVTDSEIVENTDSRTFITEGNEENILAQAEDEDDRTAASEAMKESAMDNDDFNEESNASATATPSQTPVPENIGPKNSPNNEMVDDTDFEEGVGHVDEYMLRFIADGFYWE